MLYYKINASTSHGDLPATLDLAQVRLGALHWGQRPLRPGSIAFARDSRGILQKHFQRDLNQTKLVDRKIEHHGSEFQEAV